MLLVPRKFLYGCILLCSEPRLSSSRRRRHGAVNPLVCLWLLLHNKRITSVTNIIATARGFVHFTTCPNSRLLEILDDVLCQCQNEFPGAPGVVTAPDVNWDQKLPGSFEQSPPRHPPPVLMHKLSFYRSWQ